MLVIPYSYSPERFGVFSPGLYARQFYDLVNEYVLSAIFGQWELLNLCIKQVVLVSDYKKHSCCPNCQGGRNRNSHGLQRPQNEEGRGC